MKKKTLMRLFVAALIIFGLGSANAADLTTIATTGTSSNGISSSYSAYTLSDSWVLTFGGNSQSGGTNSGNRSKCNLSKYAKYAVSPITTSKTAFALGSPAGYQNVEKVTVTWTGGSNNTRGTLYLLSSSDNTTFSMVGSKSISSATSYEFTFDRKAASTYYAVVWVDSGTSGNYRFDGITVTLSGSEAVSPGKNPVSISVDSSAATTVYTVGESLDVEGVVVTLLYDDNTTEAVTDGITFSPASGTVLNTPGNVTVTVGYQGFSATYNIMVNEAPVVETTDVLFHEGFGSNSGSARAWDDSYKEQTGVAAVYANAVYSITNAKQSKNNTGFDRSGLMQSSTGSDAEFIVGPLNLASYAGNTDVTLSYKWKAASIGSTYYTEIYYATSAAGPYVKIPHTASGATSFVDVAVSVPDEALVSTAYFKVVFRTSNTQAVIDEFDLTGKQSQLMPNAYFDLPVYFVYAGDRVDFPEYVSLSSGVVTHNPADINVVSIADGALQGGSVPDRSTVVNATIAETDIHASATASYIMKVAPNTITIIPQKQVVPFSSRYHLDFSQVEDIKVYAVPKFGAEKNSGKICAILEEIDEPTVPAMDGVILIATPKTEYEVPVILSATQLDAENYLVGALAGSEIPYSDDIFTRFTFDSNGCLYIRLEDDGSVRAINGAPVRTRTFAATNDTAYLELPVSVSETLPYTIALGIEDDGGGVTGVEDVTVDSVNDNIMYNLWGQRVDETYHGIVIVNGKKYINK